MVPQTPLIHTSTLPSVDVCRPYRGTTPTRGLSSTRRTSPWLQGHLGAVQKKVWALIGDVRQNGDSGSSILFLALSMNTSPPLPPLSLSLSLSLPHSSIITMQAVIIRSKGTLCYVGLISGTNCIIDMYRTFP